MSIENDNTATSRPSVAQQLKFFLAAMGVYLILVHIWCLGVGPQGRDSHYMDGELALPWFIQPIFEMEVQLFGSSPFGYHVVNLLLLYGCMVSIFAITVYTLRSPLWLGSLAATLTMANPLKSEAVLNFSGVVDLLPALFALGTLAFYAAEVHVHRPWKLFAALLCFSLAVLPFRENASLIVILVLYEFLIPDRKEIKSARLIPFMLLLSGALLLEVYPVALHTLNPVKIFTPIFLIVYPIGLLQETFDFYYEHTGLVWIWTGALLFVVCLMYWKIRHRAFLFSMLSLLLVRFFSDTYPFDPVSLAGGGQFIVPIALACIAFSALCHRILQHPKWFHPTIQLTTLLCIIFFVLQLRDIHHWHGASRPALIQYPGQSVIMKVEREPAVETSEEADTE
jgi:hypothetical protein